MLKAGLERLRLILGIFDRKQRCPPENDATARGQNLKFTGLTQNLGQLRCSHMDFQSNCWVNLRILGQPCEFYLPGPAAAWAAAVLPLRPQLWRTGPHPGPPPSGAA